MIRCPRNPPTPLAPGLDKQVFYANCKYDMLSDTGGNKGVYINVSTVCESGSSPLTGSRSTTSASDSGILVLALVGVLLAIPNDGRQ